MKSIKPYYRQIHLDFHTSEHCEEVGAKFDEEQFINALWYLLGTDYEVVAHTGQIRDAIRAQSADAIDWYNEVWIGKAMHRLNIWQNKSDDWRARGVIQTETGMSEEKILKHYKIKRDRLPTR